jgi:uncharacterized protein HemX
MMEEGSGRDAPRGVTITMRTIIRAVVLVALVAAACAVAFLAGQGTRLTEATANNRVKTTVERVNAQHAKELEDKLATAAKEAKAAEQKRVGRLNKMWRGRIARMKRKHERQLERQVDAARAAGINVGYASGSADGYSEGADDG